MGISFGGTAIGRPGAFSIVDTDGMVPLQVGAQKVLGFIGEAPLLAVDTDTSQALFFNTPKEARTKLGKGELYSHMETAWKHGADLIAVAVVKGTGTEGAVQDTDWDKAVDLFETETIHGIIPVTTSGAIIAKVDTHIQTMSNVLQRKERRGFYGHKESLAPDKVKEAKIALNTDRAVFATPAVYVLEGEGRVLKPSTYLAAAYAGLWANLEPQVPITYKYVQFAGLEKKYTQVDIVDFLEEGIAVTEHVDGKGLRIVQGVTAYSGGTDLSKVELSVAYLKDLMSQNLREALEEKFTGRAGVAGIENTILNYAGSVLDTFKENNWISAYYPETVHLIRTGTAFEIEWEGKPTLPINNFFITSRFVL